MAKPAVFFCTGDTRKQVLREMENSGSKPHTFADAEAWLKKCEAEHEDNGSPPSYWQKVKIFRVTVEEVPRTANAKDGAEPSSAGGK